MASLKYSANSSLQTVTLGSSYTAADGTMTLTAGHGARLPSTGDYWMAHDNGSGTVRLFKVTARSTDTLTVTPDATEGSGDGNIASGQTLRWALTAAALDQLRADIAQTGAYASASAAKAGSLYLPNNGPYLLRDTGSAMAAWGLLPPLTTPVDGDFAWINQGGATVSTTNGGLLLQGVADSGTQLRIRKKAAPATPYKIELRFTANLHPTNNNACAGFVFRESSSGKISSFHLLGNGQMQANQWNSATSWSSAVYGTDLRHNVWSEIILRMGDDGSTYRTYEIGTVDGRMFSVVREESRTSWITADEVGFFVDSESATYAAAQWLHHWKETS